MALLGGGRTADARRELAALQKARPKDPATWICAAWVEHDVRNIAAMRSAAERAAKLGAPAHLTDILRATAASASGDMEQAITRARRACGKAHGADRLLALSIWGESLAGAGRLDELTAMLESNADFRVDPRGQLLLARAHRRQGRQQEAVDALTAVTEGSASARVRRVAGSELARLLDSMGRHDAAFAAARTMHERTGAPFDTLGLVSAVEATAQLAARGAFAGMPRAAGPLPPTALICALPRSGTTLLEQMLDRHPCIHGLGESPAVHAMSMEFTALGGWPQGVLSAGPADLARIQRGYVATTRGALSLPPTAMTLDKSVRTWRCLPAVAAALPEARLLRLTRDPRDTAISLYFSPFDPRTMGWIGSLPDIQRMIAAERRWLPGVIQALALQVFAMKYEELVQDPRGHIERALQFLNLPWHEECLAPEGSARVAVTLSQEQVRRSVNTEGVGRWRNYAQHFDRSWDAIGD